MEVARLGGVAEHLAPGWLFFVPFGFNGVEDLLQLAVYFSVVEGLVEESAYNILGLWAVNV